MGDLLKPPRVHVISKEGECQVNIVIDLNINLNTGNIDYTKSVAKEEQKDEEEKTMWAIPNFKQQDKVKFGKKKEQE